MASTLDYAVSCRDLDFLSTCRARLGKKRRLQRVSLNGPLHIDQSVRSLSEAAAAYRLDGLSHLRLNAKRLLSKERNRTDENFSLKAGWSISISAGFEDSASWEKALEQDLWILLQLRCLTSTRIMTHWTRVTMTPHPRFPSTTKTPIVIGSDRQTGVITLLKGVPEGEGRREGSNLCRATLINTKRHSTQVSPSR